MVLLIFAAPIAIAALLRLVLPLQAVLSIARMFRMIAVFGGGAVGALGLLGGLLIVLTQHNGLNWGLAFALIIAGAGGVVFVSCGIAHRVLLGKAGGLRIAEFG
jgi:hypothetical protein